MIKMLACIKGILRKTFFSLLLRVNLFKCEVTLANKPRVSRKNKIFFKGKHTYIGFDCHVGADLVINNKVLIASNVSFVGGDHKFDLPGTFIMDSGRDVAKAVTIEDDVWVGHGVTVMHGVVLGEGCIVAAGSLVTKDVPPYTIYGGSPARKIRNRFQSPEDEAIHREMIKNCRFI